MSRNRWEKSKEYEKSWWQRWKARVDINYIRGLVTDRARVLATILDQSLTYTDGTTILQVGPGGNAEIHFLKGIRHAIDPLASFFKKNFTELIDPDVSYIEGMGEALPFKEASYDVILIMNVIDHCRDPLMVLDEVGRCLKPGGIMILHVNTYHPVAAVAHQMFFFVDKEHPHALTSRFVRKSLAGRYQVVDEQFIAVKTPVWDKSKYIVVQTLKLFGLSPSMLKIVARKI